MLLRDPGEQLRARDKKVASVSKQKEHDDARKQRNKRRVREQRIRWFRRELSRAETAFRVALIALPLVAFAGALYHAASLPDTWVAKHDRILSSPPAQVFATLQDLSTWQRWAKIAPLDKGDLSYPVGRVGKRAVLEVFVGDNHRVRLMLHEVERNTRVTYLLWIDGADIAREGTIELQPGGAGTALTWTEKGSFPDDPLGMLQRVRGESLRDDVMAMIGDSLAGLDDAAKTARAPKPPPEPEPERAEK